MSYILTAIPKNFVSTSSREGRPSSGVLGLSEPSRGCCHSLTTVDDGTGGEASPRANCTLTLVTNSDFLGFFGFLCVCVCVSACVFFLFVCGVVFLGFFLCNEKTVPIYHSKNRYCPSALNGITSKLSYCIDVVAL